MDNRKQTLLKFMKNNTIDKLLTALEDGTLPFSFTEDGGDSLIINFTLNGERSKIVQYNKLIFYGRKELRGADGKHRARIEAIFDAEVNRRDEALDNEVNIALSSLNKTLEQDSPAIKGFGKELFEVAKNTRSSFHETATAAAYFAKQRLSVEEIVDKLSEVDARFEVSAQDLADGLTRAGDTAKDANVSLNELLSCIKVIQEKTNRGGAVIGNALKTIFTRLKRSDTIEALMSAEVGSYDVSWYLASYRGAIAILKDYKDIRDSLDQSKRDFLDEQIAGVYQINALRALLKAL